MVDENAADVQALGSLMDTLFIVLTTSTYAQFLATWLLSISLEFFWTLINSQVNLIYLPMLSINSPGPISFYFEILIIVCTFDPIPMDIILDEIPVLEFDATMSPTYRTFFSRIGLEDRNFCMVLGSMLLFMSLFVFT